LTVVQGPFFENLRRPVKQSDLGKTVAREDHGRGKRESRRKIEEKTSKEVIKLVGVREGGLKSEKSGGGQESILITKQKSAICFPRATWVPKQKGFMIKYEGKCGCYAPEKRGGKKKKGKN